MASTALKVRVGIFVIVGICLAVGILIVLFAWFGGESTTIYVSYFTKSVSGLSEDAAVKFKGVRIGHVSSVGIAPDGEHVEVLMEVSSSFHMKPDFTSSVEYAGITGLRYVEIQAVPEGKKVKITDINFPGQKYKVIPSRPSELDELTVAVEKTLKHFTKFDVQAISDKLTSLLDNMDVLVAQFKDANTIENLNAAVAQLNNPKVGETIDYMEATTKRLHEIVDQISAEGLTDKVNALLDEASLLAGNLNAVTFELQNMTALNGTLMAAQETVRELNQTLRQGASTLIFSEPPKPRKFSGD